MGKISILGNRMIRYGNTIADLSKCIFITQSEIPLVDKLNDPGDDFLITFEYDNPKINWSISYSSEDERNNDFDLLSNRE